MGTDEKNNPSKKSILAKINEMIGTGVRIVIEEAKYFMNPKNLGHSWRRMKHEVKQAFNKALGNPTEKYISPIKTTKDSKSLGIKGGKGRNIVFEASKVFIGDIPNLSDEQLSKVKELNKGSKYSNIIIDQEKNKVVFEVDVEKIINDIQADLQNEEKSPEEIKRLAIGKIIEEADISLKGLAKITGGEFKEYADSRLLKDIGERLYQEYNNQKQQASERLSHEKQKKSCETVTLSQSKETIVPKSTITHNDYAMLSTMTNPQFFPRKKRKNTTYDKTQSINQPSSFESIIQGSDIQGLQNVSKCEAVSGGKIMSQSPPSSRTQDNKQNDGKSR